jgi:multicomponent Na+:H+ antiporter subunit D
MVIAVLGALSRQFIRGILSFHILSQIGFMVLAIGFFTPLAFAAAIFYIIHHIIVKASLFLIGGVAAELNGTDNLARGGQLWKHAPWLGVLFLAQALSLAGLPPLSGFWGKYVILVVAFEQGRFILLLAALVASLLTLMSMLKIWNATFWGGSHTTPVRLDSPRWRPMTYVIAGLTLLSLSIGLGAEAVMQVALKAAAQVLDQTGYAAAVLSALGKGGAP